MSELLRLLAAAALGYAALGAFAWFFGERVMFQPPPASYGPDEPGLVRLTTAGGARIAALHLEDPDAELTVLYSHGNAEDLGWVRPALEAVRRLGFSVLAYDYEGYGLSAGSPSEAAAYRDIDAAYRYLTGTVGVAPDRIVVHGRSLGGGPSLWLAAREPVAGLVLESTFTTAFRVVTRVPLFPFDRFRNIERLDAVDAPVLVIHGTADRVVPWANGPRLFEAAPEPKRRLWVEGAGHNDLHRVAGAAYDDALVAFRELVLQER